jgi:hypothetical protein
MASVSFEKNKKRSCTVQLESNAGSGLIIPFSQTVPDVPRVSPSTRQKPFLGRRIGKNSGRIIDTLTDGSMAE